jgi:hypothetical protein
MDCNRVGFKIFIFVKIYQSIIIFVHTNLANQSFINHMFWNNFYLWLIVLETMDWSTGKYPVIFILTVVINSAKTILWYKGVVNTGMRKRYIRSALKLRGSFPYLQKIAAKAYSYSFHILLSLPPSWLEWNVWSHGCRRYVVTITTRHDTWARRKLFNACLMMKHHSESLR